MNPENMNHTQLVRYYHSNPEEIEVGFRVFFAEFGVGRGRIDLLGVDKQRNLCVVEVKVKSHPSLKNGGKQALKYRVRCEQFLNALKIRRPVRAMVITPKGKFDLGINKSFLQRISNADLPCSREIYGLREVPVV